LVAEPTPTQGSWLDTVDVVVFYCHPPPRLRCAPVTWGPAAEPLANYTCRTQLDRGKFVINSLQVRTGEKSRCTAIVVSLSLSFRVKGGNKKVF
jgi:hypothetical protein